MVLGYGSTRLLPRGAITDHYGEPYARISASNVAFVELCQGPLLARPSRERERLEKTAE
jgi:hypothetical protein